MIIRKVLKGAKGGGKGGSKDNSPNSLRSGAYIKLIDLLGEGEIGGLVDGSRSIFFDNTPLMSGGSYNFKGVSWTQRVGLPDQPYVPGFNSVENEEAVGVQVKHGLPITRNVEGEDLDAVRVTVEIPALARQSDGRFKAHSVDFALEVRYDGGPWTNPFGTLTISGKCTSPYDRNYLINLPRNPSGASSPWSIRMVRLSDDSEDATKEQNDTVFASMTKITYGKFTYPNSAYIAMRVEAEQFGQSVPTRSYEVYGRIVQVPTNYTTRLYNADGVITRNASYSGSWNGTFKWAWTDNPAWVLYDIMTNDRFGLGEDIDASQVDKWSLYEIAQYADQNVPDGRGGNKPRFTFNGAMYDQQEAFDAIQQIASVFRGMAYWSSGSVMATQDRPKDVSILAASANAVDGSFSYQGSALTARHTVAVVKFDNPELNYEQDFVVVEDRDGIELYGYNETEILATGCTDRAQAYRIGEWALFTELNETNVVSYKAGLDHAGLRPGDIIAVQDRSFAGPDNAGRLKAGSSASTLLLDHDVTLETGQSYSVSVVLPNGTVEERDIVVSSYDVPINILDVSAPFSVTPDEEALWVLASDTLVPSLWSCISVRESEPHIYEVVGAQYEPAKFEHIDNSARFDPLPTQNNPVVQPPINLLVQESIYTQDGVPRTALLVSWTSPGIEFAVVGYEVAYDGPDGYVQVGRVPSTSVQILDAPPGDYTFYISSVSLSQRVSLPATIDYATLGWQGTHNGTIANVRLKGKTPDITSFTGSSPEFVWDNVWPTGTIFNPDGSSPIFRNNLVSIYDEVTEDLLRQEYTRNSNYVYTLSKNRADNAVYNRGPSRAFRVEVQVCDVYGRQSDPGTISVSNPPPPAVAPVGIPGFGQFVVRWSTLSDPDLAGFLVWVSSAPGFNPLTTEPYFDGMVNAITYAASSGTTYYVRVGAYDTFGKTGLNISGEIECTAVGSDDLDPPDTPTGLTSTTSLISDVQSRVIYTWDANTEPDMMGYTLEIKEEGGDWVGFNTSTAIYPINVLPSTALDARVRAYDVNGNYSAFTAVYSTVAAGDLVPPAVPTNWTAKGGFGIVFLEGDPNSERDFRAFEVYASEATDAPDGATVATHTSSANQVFITDLDDNLTLNFWVRAVDTSGNKSDWTAMFSATTVSSNVLLTTEALEGIVDRTSFATSIEVPGIGNALPDIPFDSSTPKQFFLATEGRMYVQKVDGTGWVLTTSTTILDGQIITGQIAAGAIGTDQLAANAVTAKNLSIRDFTVLADNADMQLGPVKGWANSSRIFNDPATAYPGQTWVAKLIASVTVTVANELEVPCKEGEKFYLSASVKASGAAGSGRKGVRAQFLDSAGTLLTPGTADTTSIPADWVSVSGFATAPAGAVRVRLEMIAYNNEGGTVYIANPRMMRAAAVLIEPNGITSDKITTGEFITLSAQIKDAIITDAKVANLSAAKLTAGTALAGSITVSGTALSTMQSQANDPATRINAQSTQIDPGKILISGATTLASWRDGTDTTLIAGGKLSANSVTANKLTIGARGINLENIQFSYDKTAGTVSWTAGTLRYMSTNATTGVVEQRGLVVSVQALPPGQPGVSTSTGRSPIPTRRSPRLSRSPPRTSSPRRTLPIPSSSPPTTVERSSTPTTARRSSTAQRSRPAPS
ncbi:tail protein [Rhizobium phage vB_RleS_L338C]|uniref:tail protein n=1 Tax=Rhizobium phage vB_RleS_L338C TaxID=1414737 RepID=UPI0003D846CF|nr:tail protein [Rhizobium phage vB_RleS_L338C]AHC30457.1 tail fiber protein [Rhizobium phage vB_RleS_L338C]